MRIAIIVNEFPPGPGGIGAHAYNIAHQFTNKGHPVTVYTAERSEFPSLSFDIEQPFLVHRYSLQNNNLIRLFQLFRFSWRHRSNFDWVILSGQINVMLSGMIALVLKSRSLCVIHGHEIVMAHGANRFLVRIALQNASRVVTVSKFSKKILEQNGISRPIIIISNGVNAPAVALEKNRNLNELNLITIGSVTKRKGQHNVVAALPALINKFGNVRYHIVGIPKEQFEIESLAQKLNVSNHILFHGVVNDKKKDELIRQADVLMMLSENLPDGDVEGFGIAVLEANGFGLPAIGSRGTGVEQAIEEGVSGYLVDAKDTAEICSRMETILKNYDALGRGAYLWAQKHDWSIIGKQYIGLL